MSVVPLYGVVDLVFNVPLSRGTSLIKTCLLLGPSSRPISRALRWS